MLIINYIEAQMGIYLKEKDKVIMSCRALGPSFKIRDAPKISLSYAVYIHLLVKIKDVK